MRPCDPGSREWSRNRIGHSKILTFTPPQDTQHNHGGESTSDCSGKPDGTSRRRQMSDPSKRSNADALGSEKERVRKAYEPRSDFLGHGVDDRRHHLNLVRSKRSRRKPKQ
jgi:hypothetical protein